MSSSSLSAACSSSDMTVRLDDFDADSCLKFIAENDKWPKIVRGTNSEFGSDLQVFVRKLTTKIREKYESTFFSSQDFPKIESIKDSKEFREDQKILKNVGKLFSLIFKTNQENRWQQVQSVLLIDKNFFNFCTKSTLRKPTGRTYRILFDTISKKNDHYKILLEAIKNPSRRQDLRDDNVIDEQENFESSLKDRLYPYIHAANALRKGLSQTFKEILDTSLNYDKISSLIQQNFFNKDLFLMKFMRGDFDRTDKRFEWFLDKLKMLDFDKVEDQEIARKINDFCSDGDLSKKVVLSPSERTTGVHRGAFTLKSCYNADLNQAMLYLPAIFEKEKFFLAFDYQFLAE